ncbi:MAG: transcriptional repressor LexA [candidate division KSB1 bacterium]|nr:transcriptional repressor LexA [candidate division KSB1 bacterium]
MADSLTDIQQKVLQTIIEFVTEKGFPPTIREIMSRMGYSSVNNVQRILTVLENKGHIRRNQRGGARCIEVIGSETSAKDRIKKLPIIGKLKPDAPLFATENIQGYMTIDTELLGIDADFIMRAKGEHMKNGQINENDLLLIKRTNFPDNNDMVLALLDEEPTVKRFFIEKDHFRLQPTNIEQPPILISKNDMYFRVLGRVVAVIHRL